MFQTSNQITIIMESMESMGSSTNKHHWGLSNGANLLVAFGTFWTQPLQVVAPLTTSRWWRPLMVLGWFA
jgi:hypothetical protein